MRKFFFQGFLAFAFIYVTSSTLLAQTESNQWSLGLGIGKMEYVGDRGDNALYKSPYKSQVGVRLSKYLSPLFDVSLAASMGDIGLYDRTDAPDQFEGSAFQTNFGVHIKPVRSDFIQPFVSAGIGYFAFNDDSPSTVIDNGDNSKGMVIPLGVGLKINITEGLGFYYHTQYSAKYTGDAYNGIFPESDDKYWLHEFGLSLNFGMDDRDGDRVADEKDKCPDVPGLKSLDGCPDSDLDGIADMDDDCPDVPGLAEYSGCPDTDGDGIIDQKDECPNVKGKADFDGCPDTDGDGIGDGVDECPDEIGVARYNGCPVPDTDGDGFDDENDECPLTPGKLRGCPDTDGDGFHDQEDECVDVVGTVMGCPDMDKDGVADKDDDCPEVAGVPEKNGCPEIPIPTREEIINSWKGPNIQFISGLRADEYYEENIDSIVAFHEEYPEAFIHLSGYSDSSGSEADNMVLSNRRAQKVYRALVAKGIPADNITFEGYGESNPVADNDTAEGRRKNRRVEVSASTVKREIRKTGFKR